MFVSMAAADSKSLQNRSKGPLRAMPHWSFGRVSIPFLLLSKASSRFLARPNGKWV
jgi:hypothetical protein